MDFRLTNGDLIILDKDEVFKDPRAEGLDWLRKYNGDGNGKGEGKMKERNLADYSPDELYDFKDRLKAQRPTGRGPDATHFRKVYKPTMLRRINAELRRRGLRVGKPGSRKVLPTAAHLAARGREMREAAA